APLRRRMARRRLRVQIVSARGVRTGAARTCPLRGRVLFAGAAHHHAPGGGPCASDRCAAFPAHGPRAQGRVTKGDPPRDPRSGPAAHPALAPPDRLTALEPPDVREGLAFADHADLPLIEESDRGPRGLVVVR